MTATKKRSAYWDNIKGFLMLLTVFAHILFQHQENETINSICDYIYMFHMPAFIFISGYFGKSERSSSFGAIVRLAVLYFIFNSMMWFVYGGGSLLEPVYSYWYLLAMIAWRMTARYLAKFKEIQLILICISLFAGFYPSIDNTFAISRIICFYPFYMAGYNLSAEKADETISMKYSKRIFKGIIYIGITVIFAVFSRRAFNYTDNSYQMFAYGWAMDAFGRIALYATASLAIFSLRYVTPEKEIPFLTMFGKNSLWIYLFHRPLTLIISKYINLSIPLGKIVLVSIVGTVAICLLFGNNFVVKYFNLFADSAEGIFTGKRFGKILDIASRAVILGVAVGFVGKVVINAYSGFSFDMIFNRDKYDKYEVYFDEDSKIYPVMDGNMKYEFDNAFRITFAGDLILLEDQVKRGFTGNGYDFSPVFEYAEKYISSADFAIGVFEGPMAGAEAGYSTSNFDDGKELALNFPDEFAYDVKNAGFDLVTTANNHVLDKGEDGAKRTLDILDKIGLDHVGSYRSKEEKENSRVKIIETDEMKIAVLSYTYGSNNYSVQELSTGQYSYITSVLPDKNSDLFKQAKEEVENDFKRAKDLKPDIIIVLPHMGTQFSNDADNMQKTWFEIFKNCGADVILCDHAHSVQPAVIEEYNGKNVFTACCPGNFANIYRENQGDTSMLVDVYINKNTKSVIGGSIVPLYTQSQIDGNYRALPIHDIITDSALKKQLSTDDLERANTANNIITKTVFGQEMDISSVTERYYFNSDGFIRSRTTGLKLDDEMKNGALYSELKKTDSVCFIGDSVTEGTKNGGCPWYEPIEEFIPGKKIYNFSKGGCTTSYILEKAAEIPAAGLYVIALGTNDVRYRDEEVCAMTAESYKEKISSLRKSLSEKSGDAKFVFIAPWYSTDGDIMSELGYDEKTAMNEEYSLMLEDFCRESGDIYINANPYIKEFLNTHPDSEYLLDYIHPNSTTGVLMYSEAVLKG